MFSVDIRRDGVKQKTLMHSSFQLYVSNSRHTQKTSTTEKNVPTNLPPSLETVADFGNYDEAEYDDELDDTETKSKASLETRKHRTDTTTAATVNDSLCCCYL